MPDRDSVPRPSTTATVGSELRNRYVPRSTSVREITPAGRFVLSTDGPDTSPNRGWTPEALDSAWEVSGRA